MKPLPHRFFPDMRGVILSWTDESGRRQRVGPSTDVSTTLYFQSKPQVMGAIMITIHKAEPAPRARPGPYMPSRIPTWNNVEIYIDLLPPSISYIETLMEYPNSSCPSSINVVFRDKPAMWFKDPSETFDYFVHCSNEQKDVVIDPLTALFNSTAARVSISVPQFEWGNYLVSTHGWVWDHYFLTNRFRSLRDYDFIKEERWASKLKSASVTSMGTIWDHEQD
ncbi:hypothetical protein CMUS01_00104 [Colletotrichum musicola]|uniref:Uncharacterized protein n=1 Tax=Colletotrichum musicola TaxID=2175873 RepID=A0A8H6P0L3_9PEZI|nr:hypothetical protein CMUS01_00104 [Colletotrichum musicola]